MVLTDRQRADLHAGIYEYLKSQPGDAFAQAAAFLAQADPEACQEASTGTNGSSSNNSSSRSLTSSAASSSRTPILEKKWTAIPRLQKKVLELERHAAQSAKIHAHRTSVADGGVGSGSGSGGAVTQRRMLPRLPCSHSLQGHSMVVTAVAVHPVFTVVVSGSEDGTVKVWDHESGDYMRTLKGHTNTVNAVAFSPTGSHLASCSTDLSIKLWDFSTFSCLRTLRGHDHTISAVSFVPLLELLNSSTTGASSSSGMGTSSGGPSDSGTTTGMDAAKAGAKHLLSASRDTTVKLWDVETGFCDHTFVEHTDWVRCLAVRQSDGALWASAGNDQIIHVHDAPTKCKIVELRGHEHVVESVAFVTEEPLKASRSSSAAGGGGSTTRTNTHTDLIRDYLASGSRDRTVRLWRISEGACLAVLTAHENWVRSVVIHPSGNYIISSSDDKSIRVFDIKAKRCLRTLEDAHTHFISALDMHHTLPILVSGGVDQTVKCWQLD